MDDVKRGGMRMLASPIMDRAIDIGDVDLGIDRVVVQEAAVPFMELLEVRNLLGAAFSVNRVSRDFADRAMPIDPCHDYMVHTDTLTRDAAIVLADNMREIMAARGKMNVVTFVTPRDIVNDKSSSVVYRSVGNPEKLRFRACPLFFVAGDGYRWGESDILEEICDRKKDRILAAVKDVLRQSKSKIGVGKQLRTSSTTISSSVQIVRSGQMRG